MRALKAIELQVLSTFVGGRLPLPVAMRLIDDAHPQGAGAPNLAGLNAAIAAGLLRHDAQMQCELTASGLDRIEAMTADHAHSFG